MENSVAEPSGGPVAVQLASGRVFTGHVDSRTARTRLWLRHNLRSGCVLRPIDWARVVRVKLDGEVYSGQQFHRAVGALTQTSPTDSDCATAAAEIVLGPAQTEPKPSRCRSIEPPDVRSLAIEAHLGNWDADVEADGLIINVLPLDLQGATVPVHGTLEVTLTAERVGVVKRPEPFYRLGRWTVQVRPADFGSYGAGYRLPFQSVYPEADSRWAAHGAVLARLGVPGVGVFDQTVSTVRIRTYSAVRDRLEQTSGRRFFGLEGTGRGAR